MTILQPIGTQGCGCDRRDTVKALLSVDDALALIRSQTRPVDETDVLVAEHALGRILADPITALHMTPPFDNAAMDGYAVVTSALRGKGPWELPVITRIPAGQAAGSLSGLQASRIFTGAPIPSGADAVVMQEDVQRTGATVRIDDRPAPGLNIRRAGSELAAGAEVLRQGCRLGPREIAACATAGVAQVHVRRRLRVAILVTGDALRGRAIEFLMCDFRLNLTDLQQEFGTSAAALTPILKQVAKRFGALVRCEGAVLTILPDGQPLTRIVASMFDSHVPKGVR